ncbi:hypothetical protein [Bacillus chungangensis]|uniref:Uncharacterized protein n=1 Tax=Bacillus chungangensis TaxID=587633 RepID=A0ABT9WUJ1_9BACI|nr:hypothetical protein [Bacillus chungangensis]MDQ0176977.1 hypothetical protein [Bacillus chungangensis]
MKEQVKKTTKKPLVLASALILGMTAFAPLQAGAAEKVEKPAYEIQIEDQLKGQILFNHGYEVYVKGEDGKQYRIGLYDFTKEQIEQMNLSEGADIIVEGKLLESDEYFDSFEVYKKQLPEEISDEDLAKLEVLLKEANEIKKVLFSEEEVAVEEKAEEGENTTKVVVDLNEEKWDRLSEIWEEMYEIEKVYYPEEEPETFEEYMAYYDEILEKNISSEDLVKLEALYGDYLKFLENDEDEQAWEKIDEFHEVLKPYLDIPGQQTLKEFIEMMELEVSDEDLETLKPLYEDAVAAEEAASRDSDEDWELVNEKWGLVFEFLHPHMMEARVSKPFAEFIADFEFEIKEEDLATLETIYGEINKLTADKDYEGAEDKWDAFYEALDPYFEYFRDLPFRAYQVEINGKAFKVGDEIKTEVKEEQKEVAKEAKEEQKEEKEEAPKKEDNEAAAEKK